VDPDFPDLYDFTNDSKEHVAMKDFHISAIRALRARARGQKFAGERVGKTDAGLTCGGTFGFLTYGLLTTERGERRSKDQPSGPFDGE